MYRATDTTLKRQVAIKILPPSVAADPDRLARFQREAEVLAALNHLNIAIIYGLETGHAVHPVSPAVLVAPALPALPAPPVLPAFIVMETRYVRPTAAPRRQGRPADRRQPRAYCDKTTINVVTLADHQRTTVLRGAASARYLASPNGTGHLVYVNHPIERIPRGDENRHQRLRLADVDALVDGDLLRNPSSVHRLGTRRRMAHRARTASRRHARAIIPL